MKSPGQVETTLEAAAENRQLTAAELTEVREVLYWFKAMGRIGKIVLWAIITAGAVAAAIRELRTSVWFGG